MKFEIDVDLPEAVLKEWEPVAFREARLGETFWNEVARSTTVAGEFAHFAWIILRRRFEWPAWLKCRYLVWDADGVVTGCDVLPDRNCSMWIADATYDVLHLSVDAYIAGAIGIEFPGGDWRTRIEENPNWKETT